MSILDRFKIINPKIRNIKPTTFKDCILKEIKEQTPSHDIQKLEENKSNHPFYPTVENINITQKIYDFDEIAKLLHNQKLTSTDCIIEHNNTILLIGFKSGFLDKISFETFSEENNKCPQNTDIPACEDYWNVYVQKRITEKKELINSIRLKAFESYLTLKYVLDGSSYKVKLLVIIDSSQEDLYEDILGDLSSNTSTNPNNTTKIIPKPLIKLSKFNSLEKVRVKLTPYKKFCFLSQQNYYLYDDIKVISINSLKQSIIEFLNL